jgi:hypothetical protein
MECARTLLANLTVHAIPEGLYRQEAHAAPLRARRGTERRTTMKPSLTALVFASCLLQLNAAPKHSAGLKVVTAGDAITFNLSLDTIPGFSGGRVAVLVCPINERVPDEATSSGAQFSRASSAITNEGQGNYDLSVQIPGDAPDGVWEAFFSFALPNGNYRELRHARTEFKVQRRKYAQAPRAAEIALQ